MDCATSVGTSSFGDIFAGEAFFKAAGAFGAASAIGEAFSLAALFLRATAAVDESLVVAVLAVPPVAVLPLPPGKYKTE
jgi:hypothetical protein